MSFFKFAGHLLLYGIAQGKSVFVFSRPCQQPLFFPRCKIDFWEWTDNGSLFLSSLSLSPSLFPIYLGFAAFLCI
jgi:hypothetical protein